MDEGPAPKMKKRTRPVVIQAAENIAGSATVQTPVHMNLESVNESSRMEDVVVSVHNNPLFSDNVVLAKVDNQPRQEP